MIEPHIQRLLTTEGFINAFWAMCSDYNTHMEAYEAVERLYERNFGKRRYASFESFWQVKKRYLDRNVDK